MIVDTSVVFALADADDPRNRSVRSIIEHSDLVILPEAVVVEADWLIRRRLGAGVEIAFLESLTSFAVEASSTADRSRAAALVAQYRDADIGYVDAIIVALAERLGVTRIATFDRRDFSIIRPSHVDAFELLPQ